MFNRIIPFSWYLLQWDVWHLRYDSKTVKIKESQIDSQASSVFGLVICSSNFEYRTDIVDVTCNQDVDGTPDLIHGNAIPIAALSLNYSVSHVVYHIVHYVRRTCDRIMVEIDNVLPLAHFLVWHPLWWWNIFIIRVWPRSR